MLREHDLGNQEEYARLRREVMISDHSSAGPYPWKFHSYYAYTLDEIEFLQQILHATPADIETFRERAGFMEQLT